MTEPVRFALFKYGEQVGRRHRRRFAFIELLAWLAGYEIREVP